MKKLIIGSLIISSLFATSYKDDYRYSKSWSQRGIEKDTETYGERLERERNDREYNQRLRERERENERYIKEKNREEQRQREQEQREEENTLYFEKEFRGIITYVDKSTNFDILTVKTSKYDNIRIKLDKGEVENYIYSIKDKLETYGTCQKRGRFNYTNAYYECDINFEY